MLMDEKIERDVLGFISDLEGLINLEQMIKHFEVLIASFGYEHFRCAEIARVNQPIDPKLGFGKLDTDWNARYRDQDYVYNDGTVQLALQTCHPFTWSALKENRRINSISERIFEEASQDFEYKDGLVVPIHQSDGSISGFSIIGRQPNVSPSVVRGIGMAAVYLHAKAKPIILEEKDISSSFFKAPISRRQLDCIQWVAEGKSDWEISLILGISEATVHNHVERAKRNLKVHTRVQAVVEVVRRRLIIL